MCASEQDKICTALCNSMTLKRRAPLAIRTLAIRDATRMLDGMGQEGAKAVTALTKGLQGLSDVEFVATLWDRIDYLTELLEEAEAEQCAAEDVEEDEEEDVKPPASPPKPKKAAPTQKAEKPVDVPVQVPVTTDRSIDDLINEVVG